MLLIASGESISPSHGHLIGPGLLVHLLRPLPPSRQLLHADNMRCHFSLLWEIKKGGKEVERKGRKEGDGGRREREGSNKRGGNEN